MRKYIGKYILLFVICLAVGLSVYFFIASSNQRSEGQRQTLMNRVANEVSLNDISDIDNTLSALVKNNNWAVEYGMGNVPDEYLDNYAGEMLKKQENVQGIIDRTIEQKLMVAVKDVVKLTEKNVSLEEFNKLFEA